MNIQELYKIIDERIKTNKKNRVIESNLIILANPKNTGILKSQRTLPYGATSLPS